MHVPGREDSLIVAAGEVLWDLLPEGPRLGGTTANFAIGCARLGRPSALISCLGQDAWGARARDVLRDLQRSGAELFSTEYIQTTAAAPTGVVDVLLGPDGQPRYSIAMPAAWDAIEATDETLARVRQARAICFGTLSQRAEPSRSSVRTLIEAAPPACLRVLDVNVRSPFFSDEVARWSLAHCTVAKISDEELREVARAAGLDEVAASPQGTDPASREELERCGRALLGRFPQLTLLAITMGPRGSLLLTPEQADYHPGFPVTVVDTVGAGDAFTAGLVHASLRAAPLHRVNEVGNLCGSFVASQPGATPPFSDSLLQQVRQALA